jgi:hypothetical protein
LKPFKAQDFWRLHELDLIKQLGAVAEERGPAQSELTGKPEVAPVRHAAFRVALKNLIAAKLAVERASTPDELQALSQHVIGLIGQREGDAADAQAKKALYGR